MSLKAGPPAKMFGKRLFTANLQGPDHQLLLAVLIIIALSAAVWPKASGWGKGVISAYPSFSAGLGEYASPPTPISNKENLPRPI